MNRTSVLDALAVFADEPGEVTHLAPRPWLGLAIEMQHEARFAQKFLGAMRCFARKIFHDAIRGASCIAQREARDCPNMQFELGNGTGGFRPVSGIMNTRRDLVHEQAAIIENKELDADNPHVTEPLQ